MGAPEGDPLFPQIPPAAEPPDLIAPPPGRYPDDIQTPWGWKELFVFMAFGLVCYLFLSTILVMAFYSRGITLAQLKGSTYFSSLFAVLDTLLIWLGLIGYLYFTIRVRYGKPLWRTLGWRPFPSGISRRMAVLACLLGGTLVALLVGVASSFVGSKAKLPIELFFQDRRSIWLMMAMAVVIAPIVEETLFRGYLYPMLARSLGIGGGVLLTGIIFGGFHSLQLWGGWGQIALLIVVGIFFTYVRAVTGTVLASYLLHVSYNFFLFASFYFATSGFHKLPSLPH
ncbi:MAG: lysostaphin resistance A-like protein [Candidatus Acidiferrales bacterium]